MQADHPQKKVLVSGAIPASSVRVFDQSEKKLGFFLEDQQRMVCRLQTGRVGQRTYGFLAGLAAVEKRWTLPVPRDYAATCSFGP